MLLNVYFLLFEVITSFTTLNSFQIKYHNLASKGNVRLRVNQRKARHQQEFQDIKVRGVVSWFSSLSTSVFSLIFFFTSFHPYPLFLFLICLLVHANIIGCEIRHFLMSNQEILANTSNLLKHPSSNISSQKLLKREPD